MGFDAWEDCAPPPHVSQLHQERWPSGFRLVWPGPVSCALALLRGRCGGLRAPQQPTLAPPGHVPGHVWGGPRLPASFGRTSVWRLEFRSGGLGGLFLWMYPGWSSLSGWRKTLAPEPCQASFFLQPVGGSQQHPSPVCAPCVCLTLQSLNCIAPPFVKLKSFLQ